MYSLRQDATESCTAGVCQIPNWAHCKLFLFCKILGLQLRRRAQEHPFKRGYGKWKKEKEKKRKKKRKNARIAVPAMPSIQGPATGKVEGRYSQLCYAPRDVPGREEEEKKKVYAATRLRPRSHPGRDTERNVGMAIKLLPRIWNRSRFV